MISRYTKLYGGNKRDLTSQVDTSSKGVMSRIGATFRGAMDTARNVKDYVVNGVSNNLQWVANKGSQFAGAVVDTAKSAGSWVADKASGAWNAAGEAKDWLVNKASNLFFGSGKYGRGYFKQDDPRYANLRFNARGDTEYQDFRNSACGPIAAVNALYGGDKGVSPEEAAMYALKGGYKERNGGTKPQFFTSYFQAHGRDAQYTSSSSNIMRNLRAGNPVVLQGKSNKIDSDTPYGVGPHYVTATGLDRNGNMIIQDSQDPRNNVRYDARKVLSKTQFGIASQPKAGRSKYGKGYSTFLYRYGRGPADANAQQTTQQSSSSSGGQISNVGSYVWQVLTTKYGFTEPAAAGVLGNMMQESTMNPDADNGEGAYGLCQWTEGRQQRLRSLAASAGVAPSNVDLQLDFMVTELKERPEEIVNTGSSNSYEGLMKQTTPEDAARYFHEEFERAGAGAEMGNRIMYAQQAMASKGADLGGSGAGGGYAGGAAGAAGAQQTGGLIDQYLGKLAKPMTDMYNKLFGGAMASMKGPGAGANGANFGGMSSNPNIKAASQYANSRVGTTGYGNNGCTTWVNDYLQHAGVPAIDMWVPNAMDNSKNGGNPAQWKDASQGGVEGDVAVIETNHNPGDGPDHVVIADGQGGYWGNSSSKNQIVHGDMAGDWGAENIYGYIATGGNGTGNVAQGGMTRSAADAQGDATLDGQGKFGRGKFGMGGKHKVPPIIAKNQYGEGFLDNLVDYGTKIVDTKNRAEAYDLSEEWLEKIYKVLCVIANNTAGENGTKLEAETAKDRNANNANAQPTGTAKARTDTAKEVKKNDNVSRLIEGINMFKKAKGLGQVPNDLDIGGIISTMRSIASE